VEDQVLAYDPALPTSFVREPVALQDVRRISQNAADVTGTAQQIARPFAPEGRVLTADVFIDLSGQWWQVTERIEPNPVKQAALGFHPPEDPA
jgi:hypothetical protein